MNQEDLRALENAFDAYLIKTEANFEHVKYGFKQGCEWRDWQAQTFSNYKSSLHAVTIAYNLDIEAHESALRKRLIEMGWTPPQKTMINGLTMEETEKTASCRGLKSGDSSS